MKGSLLKTKSVNAKCMQNLKKKLLYTIFIGTISMGIQSYGTIAYAIMALNPLMNVIVMICRQRYEYF